MTSGRALGLVLLLAPALVTAQPRPKVQPRPHSPPAVRLLEPGGLPRAALRYALSGSQQATVIARGGVTIRGPAGTASVTYPQITTPLVLTAQKGGVHFRWLAGSLVAAPGQPPDAVTRHLLTALEGSTGVFTTDARGIISKFDLRPGPNDLALDAGTIQVRTLYALEMAKGMLGLLEVPLPEEPVGPGARWQVERIAVRGPLSFIQFTTFTLLERVGNTLELSYRFGGLPDVGSGLRESEIKLAVSGGGTCTVDLARPLPVTLEDEVRVNAQLLGKDGQVTHHAGLVGTRIESK